MKRYPKLALYGVVSGAATMGIFLILRQLIYNAAPDFYARNLLMLGDIRPREVPAVGAATPSSPSTHSKTDTSNEISGVGINLGVDEESKELVVVNPIDGSPAIRAGVRPKDVIVSIDGKSPKGMTMEEAAELIRGKSGSTVTLTLRREDVFLDIPLVRERIALPAGEQMPASENQEQPEISAAPPPPPPPSSTSEPPFNPDCASFQSWLNQQQWQVPTKFMGYENLRTDIYRLDNDYRGQPNGGKFRCKGGYVQETSPMGTKVCQAQISYIWFARIPSRYEWTAQSCRWQ